MAIDQESNRKRNRQLLFRGTGKLPGVEIAVQEGLTFLGDRIESVAHVLYKTHFNEIRKPRGNIIAVPINALSHVNRIQIPSIPEFFQNRDVSGVCDSVRTSHYRNARIRRAKDLLGFDVLNLGNIIHVLISELSIDILGLLEYRENGTSYGSGRPEPRNAIRGIPLRESCEPVFAAPARGGSAGTSSETMSNHDSTGHESREPDDASKDEDILIAGDGSEILTDGGQQVTPLRSAPMRAGETRKVIRVECWECDREFFIPMDERGSFDQCPYCGNEEGLGVQGRTFEVSA